MNNSIRILRELAKTYRDLAMEDRNAQTLELHRRVNDLESQRPIVLIDEVPWHELNIDNQLTLLCEGPIYRAAEDFFRKHIFQYKNFRGDMVLKPYLPVKKIVEESSIGISIQEDILSTDDGNNIVSHGYSDLLAKSTDIDKIVIPNITYNENETLRRYNLLSDAIGDILPIRVTGLDYMSVTSWDDIAEYRGVTPLLIDLLDRPEHSRNYIRKLTDIYKHRLNRYEALNLFDDDPNLLHCTAIATNDLEPVSSDGHVKRNNIWGRGAAQVFSSVSKQMRDEFDIPYMNETIGQCGLVYYGCCEPLDKMIDVVEKIQNLRKISITPWADIDNAAEVIGSKYVIASKPNPAMVAVNSLNEPELRSELNRILTACKRNGSHADIVLKDISTIYRNPENLFRWEQIAMEMVNNY